MNSRFGDVWPLIICAMILVVWFFGWPGLVIYVAAASLVNAITRVMEK